MNPSPTPQAAPTQNNVPGIPAYGTLIQVLSDPGPPEVYTNIEGAGDITGPGTTVGEIETTSHSTGAPVRTYKPGLLELGDISFPCYWDPSDPTQSFNSPYGLEALVFSRKVVKFQLINTDPAHYTRQFPGFVKSIAETAPVNGIMTRAVSVRISGAYTVVPAAINVDPTEAPSTAAGGPGTFDVAAGGSHAPWQALATVPWITITSPSGVQEGDASVAYTVDANATGQARTGHVDISGLNLSFAVNQAATK